MRKRILFFGMRGLFSRLPFEQMLEQGANICAVVVPAEQAGGPSLPRQVEPPAPVASDLPLLTPYVHETIVQRAWQHDIPVWEVGKLSNPKTLAVLAALRPDLICVVCFPYLFPQPLLELPWHGCVNLHPSLLPAYRGPTPLFWQVHQGETQTGVTLHFLDAGVDSGDIIAQTAFPLPEGISEMALTQRCAEKGGQLLVEAVKQVEAGPLPRRPQGEENSSYFPSPAAADLRIPPTWPARRAFNFLRGADSWPLVIDLGDAELVVETALGYDEDQALSEPYIRHAGEIWIQFAPGVLKAQGIMRTL